MPVRKRNLRLLCGLKEMASQTFPYTSASIAYKTLKKIIFEYWMVRGKNMSAPSPATANCAGGRGSCPLYICPSEYEALLSCGTALLLFTWKILWITFLVYHSAGQLQDSRLRTEFSESGMYKISSAFLCVFIYLYFLPTLLKACPKLFRSRNWTESSQSW